MKVYVPWAKKAPLRTETLIALRELGAPATALYCQDDGDYYRYARHLWSRRVNFIICEHDAVPRRADYLSLVNCEHEWCGFPTSVGTGYKVCLSFTKFAGTLQSRHPDALDLVGAIDDDGLPARHWARLDSRLERVLHDKGEHVHTHTPPIYHANPRQWVSTDSEPWPPLILPYP